MLLPLARASHRESTVRRKVLRISLLLVKTDKFGNTTRSLRHIEVRNLEILITN